jgi:hypothetical protein
VDEVDMVATDKREKVQNSLKDNHFTVLIFNVNTSGKAGTQILHLPLGDDSSPRGR